MESRPSSGSRQRLTGRQGGNASNDLKIVMTFLWVNRERAYPGRAQCRQCFNGILKREKRQKIQ
jgi:hypothetical protein